MDILSFIRDIITVAFPIIFAPLIAKYLKTRRKAAQAQMLVTIADDVVNMVRANNPNVSELNLVTLALAEIKKLINGVNPSTLDRVVRSSVYKTSTKDKPK